jgi:nucleotide-binding universal stress UspA family protein
MARAHAEREGVTMKNILVAADGSEPAMRALAMGADLAVRYGATLHLVHVALRPMVVSEGLKEFARAERVDLRVAVEMSAEGQSLVAAGQATAIARGVHAPKTSVLPATPPNASWSTRTSRRSISSSWAAGASARSAAC